MQRDLRQRIEEDDSTEVDLAPLLDVVFILLIFFIVTSVFVRETGVEVDKPAAISSEKKQKSILLIAITRDEQIVHAGADIGIDGVRRVVTTALRDKDIPVLIQADKHVPTQTLVRVIDEAKIAGASNVSIATDSE